MIPMVDILYFTGSMILVIFMAVFIIRSMKAEPDDPDDGTEQ